MAYRKPTKPPEPPEPLRGWPHEHVPAGPREELRSTRSPDEVEWWRARAESRETLSTAVGCFFFLFGSLGLALLFTWLLIAWAAE